MDRRVFVSAKRLPLRIKSFWHWWATCYVGIHYSHSSLILTPRYKDYIESGMLENFELIRWKKQKVYAELDKRISDFIRDH